MPSSGEFMNEPHNPFETRQSFDLGNGKQGSFYSLPQLEKAGVGPISKLPVSIRLVLESVLRNCDGKKVSEANVRELANWKPTEERTAEIPFVVARIVLQDFTGVPLLVDLAAMRSAVARMGKNPKIIEPLVPVDLVVDHSVQVDFAGSPDALKKNLDLEFTRNRGAGPGSNFTCSLPRESARRTACHGHPCTRRRRVPSRFAGRSAGRRRRAR